MSAAGEPDRQEAIRLPDHRPMGPQVVMLILGISLFAVGTIGELGALGLILAGVGLTMTGFVVAIFLNREMPTELRIDEPRRLLTVASRDGRLAPIPMPTVASVRVGLERGSGTLHGLWLDKRDGGRIQLARFRNRRDADEIATRLRSAVDAAAEAPASMPTPEQRFEGSPFVQVSREQAASSGTVSDRGYRQPPRAPALQLSWPAARPARASIPFLAGAAGIGLSAYGLYAHGTGLAASIIVGAFAAGLAALLLSGLRQMGVRESIRVDDEQVTIERRRGGSVLRQQALPLHAVTAVDYTHEAHTTGGMLELRTGASDDAAEVLEREASTEAGGAEPAKALILAEGMVDLVRANVHISLGPLSLADRINVDVALSEELAHRLGDPSQSL